VTRVFVIRGGVARAAPAVVSIGSPSGRIIATIMALALIDSAVASDITGVLFSHRAALLLRNMIRNRIPDGHWRAFMLG